MGSVHRNINLIERTNKMRPCSIIYIFQSFLIAQHVSGDTPPIIRSSKTTCSLWFYVRSWLQVAAMAEPSQRQKNKNICETTGCKYSFWVPDDGRCIARNMLSN
jgi:hypothetical protein